LFSLCAFEPSDTDLSRGHEEEDVEMTDVPVKGKAKARAKRGARRMPDSDEVIVIDSDEEESEDDDDDDDMSDFIVESDEDEEEKDIRRALKRNRANRRPIVLDSDDEDTPEDSEAIFGERPKTQISQEQIKLMPRFLPSTKMKVLVDPNSSVYLSLFPIANDGHTSELCKGLSRREGMLYLATRIIRHPR
jgi:hypothetical protein